ncbi:ParB N-terminal domain-containing protein [Aquibaculum sediminis]|uniref:ParB N-terminal domain-containing protein n=1 Tax=Aquibaculum sediminis TaxID=3231907 RepID=UPI0034559D55
MLHDQKLPMDRIYVPTKLRTLLDPEKVEEIAASILEEGQKTPILVRRDGQRFVLVEGVHRLEACRALGESTITGLLVNARR